MDRYALKADPCDNRLIRCENCIQTMNCIFAMLECFIPRIRECEHILQEITNCTMHTMVGMMVAQTLDEVEARSGVGNQFASLPPPYGYDNVPMNPVYPQQQHHHGGYVQPQGYGEGYGAGYGAVPVAEAYPAQQHHHHHHRDGPGKF